MELSKTNQFSDLPLLSIGNTIQLVGAVYAGEGNAYLLLLPDETLEGQAQVMEMTEDDWKTCLSQSDVCQVEVTNGVEKAIVRKCERQVDSVISWRVYERDDFRCRYCGGRKPLTVDHLILWEEGGPSIAANLMSCCRKCNRIRGNTQYADWLESQDYKRLSAGLPDSIKLANQQALNALPTIKRVNHLRSR